MVSFLIGILFTNIFGKAYVLGVGLLGEYFLMHFRYTQINYNRLLGYIFQERMKLFLIIGILGVTNIGIPVIGAFFGWLGFSSGVFLSVAVMKFGVKGIVISLGATFPHFLVYIPFMLICSDKLIDKKLSDKKNWGKQNWVQYILLVVIGVFFMTIGVLLESYVNPLILKKILTMLSLSS